MFFWWIWIVHAYICTVSTMYVAPSRAAPPSGILPKRAPTHAHPMHVHPWYGVDVFVCSPFDCLLNQIQWLFSEFRHARFKRENTMRFWLTAIQNEFGYAIDIANCSMQCEIGVLVHVRSLRSSDVISLSGDPLLNACQLIKAMSRSWVYRSNTFLETIHKLLSIVILRSSDNWTFDYSYD